MPELVFNVPIGKVIGCEGRLLESVEILRFDLEIDGQVRGFEVLEEAGEDERHVDSEKREVVDDLDGVEPSPEKRRGTTEDRVEGNDGKDRPRDELLYYRTKDTQERRKFLSGLRLCF